MADTTKHGHGHHDEANPQVVYEHSDANTLAVTKFGIGLTLVVVFSIVLVGWVFNALSSRAAAGAGSKLPPTFADRTKLPPEPRLQATPRPDLARYFEDEAKALNGYRWIDPEKGTVAIPVDQALDTVAAKGFPPTPPMPASAKQTPEAMAAAAGKK